MSIFHRVSRDSALHRAPKGHLPEGKGEVTLEVDKVEAFLQDPPQVLSHTPSTEIQELASSNQATPGGKIRYQIDGTGKLGDLWQSLDCTAISGGAGNYAPVPGLNVIDHVLIKSGAKRLIDYDYAEAFQSFVNGMTQDERQAVYAAAGGAASPSGEFMAPIFTPWSTWFDRAVPSVPLDLDRIPQGLLIEITLKPAASVTASGIDSFTCNGTLIMRRFTVPADQQALQDKEYAKTGYTYRSYDITTLSSTIATATTGSIELAGLASDVARISWAFVTAANIAARTNYTYAQALTGFELKVGSELLNQQLTKSANRMDAVRLMDAREGFSGGAAADFIGGYQMMTSLHISPGNYFGGLALQNVNSAKLRLTHSDAGTLTTHVCVWSNAQFVVKDGSLEKIE